MGLAPLLSLFTLLLLLLPLLALPWPPALGVWVLLTGGYLVVATATAVVSSWRAGRPDLWWRVLVCFPAIHFGAGLGFLAGLLRGPAWSHRDDRGDHR